MIELPHIEFSEASAPIKIVGIGGAGGSVVDRIQLDGIAAADCVVINTDGQALASSVAPQRIQIGHGVTRGLGAGGDPEMGYQAAEESAEELRGAVGGGSAVFLCVGLGGGTGSGAAPLVAQCAREQGALVVVFATMPFSFEGRRRQAQAQEALDALRQRADLVVCFDNDRMADGVAPKAAIQEAFAAADRMISQSVRSLAALLRRPGMIRAGVADLATVLRGRDARCLFGFGTGSGGNRAHEALEGALKSPLMDSGRIFAEVGDVIVNVAGGDDLTLKEVEVLMNELNRHIHNHTRIFFSTAVDSSLVGRLEVVLISATGQVSGSAGGTAGVASTVSIQVARPVEQKIPVQSDSPKGRTGEEAPTAEEAPIVQSVSVSGGEVEEEPPVIEGSGEGARASGGRETEVAVEPQDSVVAGETTGREARMAAARARVGVREAGALRREARHEQMQFEPVARGRFEKSEPTVVDGQDLDVPTFLRRNV
jgi:cell division protein FtsZ